MGDADTGAANVTIRLAELDDIHGIADLEQRYAIHHDDPGQGALGFLSVVHSESWFADLVAKGDLIVGVNDGARTVAFYAFADFEHHYPSPILDQMAATAETVKIDGAALTSHRLVTSGPICIHEDYRHHGVYALLMGSMRQYAGADHDMAVSFISAANEASLQAAQHAGGAELAARFSVDGKDYYLVVRRLV